MVREPGRLRAAGGRVACAVAASLACGGCTHTYVFAGSAPPRMVGGELVVERYGEQTASLAIEHVLVQDARGRMRLPSTAEIRAWQAGDATPDIDLVRVDVATTEVVWRDWIMPGFGIGAGLVFMTVGGLGVVEPDGTNGLTLPLTVLIAAVLGLEGALIGGGIGALAESGTTDMRFPGGVDLGAQPKWLLAP